MKKTIGFYMHLTMALPNHDTNNKVIWILKTVKPPPDGYFLLNKYETLNLILKSLIEFNAQAMYFVPLILIFHSKQKLLV